MGSGLKKRIQFLAAVTGGYLAAITPGPAIVTLAVWAMVVMLFWLLLEFWDGFGGSN
jgi:hypothetical protein